MAPRPLFMLLTLVLLLMSSLFALAENADKNLIPVKPQYVEASGSPSKPPEPEWMKPPPATPAEQMYVFWFLGQALSWPVDKLETYFNKIKDDWTAKAVQATAPAKPNPFETRDFSQIPPAPPVTVRTNSR